MRWEIIQGFKQMTHIILFEENNKDEYNAV